MIKTTFARRSMFAAVAALAVSLPVIAQAGPGNDTSALRPPAGASVAIVEFSDLQCPACALANPAIVQAVEKYKIPLVRHDLLIPGHIWSPLAAVYARWFDSKNPKLGEDFRGQVFANQRSIETLYQLRYFTEQFAQSHGVRLPPDIDPQGKLAAAVQADTALSRRTGIIQTPTVFVVTSGSKSAPYTRVLDIQNDLDRYVAEAVAANRTAPTAAKKPRGK